MGDDDYQYRSVRKSDASEIPKRERTCWKTIEAILCAGCILFIAGIVALIVSAVLASNCSLQSPPATYDATGVGPNGWVLFVPTNVNYMHGAKINTSIYSASLGGGISADSPTTLSWNNGIPLGTGSSNSYGIYSTNVSLTLYAPGDDAIDVSASVLLWCSDCSIHAPENKCAQDVIGKWSIYRVSFSVPSLKQVSIDVSPRTGGTIRIQGAFL